MRIHESRTVCRSIVRSPLPDRRAHGGAVAQVRAASWEVLRMNPWVSAVCDPDTDEDHDAEGTGDERVVRGALTLRQRSASPPSPPPKPRSQGTTTTPPCSNGGLIAVSRIPALKSGTVHTQSRGTGSKTKKDRFHGKAQPEPTSRGQALPPHRKKRDQSPFDNVILGRGRVP
jgi:hypothetical protein